MRIAIHQPQYMPWLGYLDKVASCDKFIFLDDVQYKKREFQNRNRIRTPQGTMWLTVPVLVKGKYSQNINEVMINNSVDWRRKHIEAIKRNYSSAPFFDSYFENIENIFKRDWEYLCELNIAVATMMFRVLGIDTPWILSSEMGVESLKTQRIIDICRAAGADEYLSGAGARDYMKEDMFEKERIKLVYQDFSHPEYRQNFEGFISHLSAIDYIFNCGDDFNTVRRNR